MGHVEFDLNNFVNKDYKKDLPEVYTLEEWWIANYYPKY